MEYILFSIASYVVYGGFLGFCHLGVLRRFLCLRPFWPCRIAAFCMCSVASSMIVWVGDNNLLLTLPFYFVLLFFCTQGDWQARLVVPACLFCIAMSLNALIDSASRLYSPHDFVSTLLRCLAWLLLYLVARRFFGRPASSLSLSPRLWWIALGLTVAPLSALITVVLVNGYNDTQVGLVQTALILPFVLLSALAILFSLVQLSRQWALEQEHQLASMREVYYQGIQREQQQVRRLRHDMANHWTALCGFLEAGQTERALDYLQSLQSASHSTQHFCANQAADIVLSAKAAAAGQAGVCVDWQVELPEDLPVADLDLCALLGNALDNAIEAAAAAADKKVVVRARADKGVLMLRVENSVAGPLRPQKDGLFATTKADSTSHGFGLKNMEQIAQRYGGTLQASAGQGRFELLAWLPLGQPPAAHDKKSPSRLG